MIRLKLEKDQLLPVLVQKYETFLTNLLKNRGEKLEELARVCDEPQHIWLTTAIEYSAAPLGYAIVNITNTLNGAIKLLNGNVSLIERSLKTIKATNADSEKTEDIEISVDIYHLATRLANCVLNHAPSYEGWAPQRLLTSVDKGIQRLENGIESENLEINKVLESFDTVSFTSEK